MKLPEDTVDIPLGQLQEAIDYYKETAAKATRQNLRNIRETLFHLFPTTNSFDDNLIKDISFNTNGKQGIMIYVKLARYTPELFLKIFTEKGLIELQ